MHRIAGSEASDASEARGARGLNKVMPKWMCMCTYGCVCVRRVPGAGGALGRGCGLPMRRAPAGIGSRISCTMGLFVFAGAHAEEKGTSEH